MQSILLQVEPTTTLWTRLGDQAFTIVLLVTIAYILWNRITKLQDKMDNYLGDDRKQMQEQMSKNTEVIAKNTEVIEKFLNQRT